MIVLLSLLAHADDVELVLHDPRSRSAPTDACDVRLCSSLLELIKKSTTSIDFAFYGFRNQTALFEALSAARDRGVKIRGVVDMDVANVNYYDSTREWMAAFPDIKTDHQVDLATKAAERSFFGSTYACTRPPGFAGPLQCVAFDLGGQCYLSAHASREPITFEGDIMHDKFVVVDGRYVWTGSTNASDSCSGGYNANLVMVVDSPTVARWYTGEFEQMYGGRFHTTKAAQSPMRTAIGEGMALEVLFSPQHTPIRTAVLPLLDQARTSIDVAVFFLTHKGIAEKLIAAHKRGVKVRILLDSTGASNEYSKHEALRLAGIPLKIEDFGGKMHAKSAVIDSEIVIGGSMNWTNAGDDSNDENTIVLRSREHAAQYQRWFDTLWAAVPDRWLEGRPDAESKDSGRACFDGVDNDHDHLADDRDPGCSARPPPLPSTPPYQLVPLKGEKCSWDLIEVEKEE
jgi:phosphatidylserine/phosphatidylglycerophosphate/cardiolipin synthase-like enzyme